jgi:hypothetical protein
MTLGPDVAEARPARPYRMRTVSLGGPAPGIDLDRSLRLADVLDDEAQIRKLEFVSFRSIKIRKLGAQ